MRLAYVSELETMPKFLKLNIFWIKLSDFMDIVPRHPHLEGIRFHKRAMAMTDMPSAKPSIPHSINGASEQSSSPLVNGQITNGEVRRG